MKQLFFTWLYVCMLVIVPSLQGTQKYNKSVHRLKKICSLKSPCAKTCFQWPVDHTAFWVSSLFGMRTLPSKKKRMHYGVDFAARSGTKVYASASGVVDFAGKSPGYGMRVDIKHIPKHVKTRYAHLSKILVKQGQQVKQGQCIGHVGMTGHVVKKGKDASHLHFELLLRDKRVDPFCCLLASPCG